MEYQAFSKFINLRLADDSDVKHILPLNPVSNDLLFNVSDGLLLAKLLALLKAGVVDVDQVLSLSAIETDDVDVVRIRNNSTVQNMF